MKLLITGGAGFIGSAVVRHLLQDTDHSLVNLDKLTYAGNLESCSSVSDSPRYAFEQVDICNRTELDRVFKEHQPDVVMHLAAESHVDRSIDGPGDFIQTNIVGTYNLLEAARSYWSSLEGERKQASANKSLGRFDLSDIPPAPRGVPQIEVTFDIDANGILNVSAKDKATGKEQSIVIKANSGLSDEEVEQMIRDAEANADEDRKFEELATARNQGDQLVHATRKMLTEAGDKVTEEEKTAIEAAVAELEAAVKGDSKTEIEAKIEALSQVSAPVTQKMYAEQAQQADATAASDDNADDVVDAEFEEVKDTDTK